MKVIWKEDTDSSMGLVDVPFKSKYKIQEHSLHKSKHPMKFFSISSLDIQSKWLCSCESVKGAGIFIASTFYEAGLGFSVVGW